jgi:uncharacterized protein (DUF1501 family)
MQRRTFLQRLAATGIVLPMTMGFPRVRAFAQSPQDSPFTSIMGADNDRVLVIVRLAGGNDGLNTVVPYTNQAYYTARAEGQVFINANEVLKLPDSQTMGLHPSLRPLMELYNEKKMTIVQNVAYPNQNLSHFRSTDIWLSGSDANVFQNSGWFGRYLETKYPDYPATLPKDPFAIELGTYLSTTCVGEKTNMGVAVSSLDYIPNPVETDPVAMSKAGDEEAYVREIIRQSNVFSNAIVAAGYKQQTNKVQYGTDALAQGLASIARVIAGGLGTRLYIVNVGGYDTHGNQLADHATLHDRFAKAVLAFQRDMEAFGLANRVCLMTISEFGRRPESNGTGTDHGSAAPMFVFGAGLRGGILGNDPNLSDLDEQRNLKMQYDFRQIYASVLGQWFGATEADIAPKALPRNFAQLPIFQTATSTTRTNSTTNAVTDDGEVVLGQNYPNPATSFTTIPLGGLAGGSDGKVTVFAADGRVVAQERVAAGQPSVTISTESLTPGNYIYTLESGGKRRTRQMSVQR